MNEYILICWILMNLFAFFAIFYLLNNIQKQHTLLFMLFKNIDRAIEYNLNQHKPEFWNARESMIGRSIKPKDKLG